MQLHVNTSIPISFEKLEDIADNRFTKVKVWLCHTGENLNGSYFSKEVLQKMLPTLANIPIVGYISANNTNESDFKGHEQRLVIDDNGISIEYLGRAYGFIGTENNAKFENKVCLDNVEREFLTCEGLLWNKFSECADIFERDSLKSQSMELQPGSVVGKFEKDNLFHFENAKFEAACILGEGIIPAMTGSIVEKFSLSSITGQLEEMLNELKFSLNEDSAKEVKSVEENEKVEVEEVVEIETTEIESTQPEEVVEDKFESQEDAEVEEVTEVVETVEEIVVEETTEEPSADVDEVVEEIIETEVEEEFAKSEEKDDIDTMMDEMMSEMSDDMTEEMQSMMKDITDKMKKKMKAKLKDKGMMSLNSFELSHDDVREKIYNILNPINEEGYRDWNYYILEVFDAYFIAQDEKNISQYYKFTYSVDENDNVTVGEKQEVVMKWLTPEEAKQFTTTEEEIESLKAFKYAREKEDKLAVVAKFTALTVEEVQPLKDNIDNYSVEDLELQLFALLGKKNVEFSASGKSNQEKSGHIMFSLSNISTKTDSDKPAYADLVERYKAKTQK